MQLRPPAPQDLEALNHLVWASKSSWGYPSAWLREKWPELQLTPDLLLRGRGVVAWDGQVPAAFYLILPEYPEWILDHLWVSPDHQGRGLGRRLLDHAAADVARAGRAGLRIDSDPNAEPFYLRFGAERRGVIPAPMPGAPDRVRPQLWLPAGPFPAARVSSWSIAPTAS